MQEALVYPGKLPIVSGGNSLWERAPQEHGSAQHVCIYVADCSTRGPVSDLDPTSRRGGNDQLSQKSIVLERFCSRP